MTSADLCRKRGYRPGDVLRGTRRWPHADSETEWVRITAIGEERILARTIAYARGSDKRETREGPEVLWVLDSRPWRRVRRGAPSE